MDLKSFHRGVLAIALLVYGITAWNSTGFHGADEHYQTIAFAQWKMGDLPAGAMAWEFSERIRSSLQPWVAVGAFSLMDLAGLHGPLPKMLLLRLITALLWLAAMHAFVKTTVAQVEPPFRKPYLLLAYLLWFLPFLQVRFASEAWSSLCLIGAVALFTGPLAKPGDFRLAGIWLALAACLRPGTLPAIAAMVCWLLVVRRPRFGLTFQAMMAGSGILLLSFALDTVFYGVPTFSLGRYLAANFPGHASHAFDVLPWWYYPPLIVKYTLPPIGLCLLAAFALVAWHRPLSVTTWCIGAMLGVLSIVPHKELRFLYPLAGLAPWVLVQGWSIAFGQKGILRDMNIRPNTLGMAIAAINVAALVVVAFTPADAGRIRLAEAIRRAAGSRPAVVEYTMDTVPPWAIRIPPFYLPTTVSEAMTKDPCGNWNAHGDSLVFLITNRRLPRCGSTMHWEQLEHGLPAWGRAALRAYLWEDARPGWTLYQAVR